MLDRLFSNWAYATLPVSFLLVGLYPFIGAAIALPLFLSLPVYMFHQYEEHDNNRFAEFLNEMMGSNKKGLSPADIWIVNVIFVWFFLLVVFYIASHNLQWGVLAAYLLAINALLHLVWALLFQKYNPGLWTAMLMFFPLSIWIYLAIPAKPAVHIASAILVIVLHVSILILARRPASDQIVHS